MKPGEMRKMTIDYAIFDEKAAIEEVRGKIRAIQGSTKPQLDSEPVALPAP